MSWLAFHFGRYSPRISWRTRDIEGNLFRQAKSNSKPEAGPPRDRIGTERFKQHLPLQVFCCESGTHVVDPEQSYYRDIKYRSSPTPHNLSSSADQPNWDPDTQCMDSTQMWFCRDLWTDAAKDALKNGKKGAHRKLSGNTHKRDLNQVKALHKRAAPVEEEPVEVLEKRQQPGPGPKDEGDEDMGTNVDAMDEETADPAPEPLKPEDLPASAFLIPNSVFTPARILVNPRCLTTYGGVSHTQLALDLFGTSGGDDEQRNNGNYVLEDWAGPPDSFVCQEMKTTGGRTAPKSQRRVGFLLENEVSNVRAQVRATLIVHSSEYKGTFAPLALLGLTVITKYHLEKVSQHASAITFDSKLR